MAMIKDIEFESGVVAKYHRILRMNADYNVASHFLTENPDGVIIEVEVGAYISEAARRAGKKPVMREVRSLMLNGEPSREAVYAALSIASSGGYTGATKDVEPIGPP